MFPQCEVQKYRVWKSLTQQELADATKIPVISLRKIEAGAMPKYQIRKRLADFFGVSQSQLWVTQK